MLCSRKVARLGFVLAGLAAGFYLPRPARAHCDTLDGPVVTDARAALEEGDVTVVLKWVPAESEGEIRTAFQKTLTVRAESAAARELADMYFYETLVRVHRAGEGAPYTGLKPAGTELEPGVLASDKALETGDVEALVKLVTERVAAGIRERFARASAARTHVADDIGAGRRFVAAYIELVHFVGGLYNAAEAEPAAHERVEDAHAESALSPHARSAGSPGVCGKDAAVSCRCSSSTN